MKKLVHTHSKTFISRIPKMNVLLNSLLLLLFSLLVVTNCTNPSDSNTATSDNTSTETDDNAASDPSGKVLMAVFAHPDDESTVAPILSRYVREGAKVHLVIVTDGRLGVNDFTDHEAGDGLAAMRRDEMKCAAEVLGVDLIHLKYHDQLRAAEGYDGHIPHVRALIKEIHQLVTDIQPDVLLTFGPDGASNHMDHRLTGATVTAVFVNKAWEKPSSLYFVSRPTQKIDDPESKILRGVDEKYLTTQISFTDEDFEKAVESISCHKSQMRLDGLRERMESRYGEDKKIYLRKFVGPTDYEESIFN